jgi:hypothetical protein
MSVFRRRRDEQDAPTENAPAVPPTPPSPSSIAAPSPEPIERRAQPPATEVRIPAHIERALITLTTKMQQCVERLDILEHRVDELAESVMNAPSHSDVLEVRMHSAKLAAEIARATVELRGEIGMASDEARRAARMANATTTGEVPVTMPVDVEIEKADAIDLTETEDSENNSQRPGWSQSA